MSEEDIKQSRGMKQALQDTVDEARIADVVQSCAYGGDVLRPVDIDDTREKLFGGGVGVIRFRRDGCGGLRRHEL